MSASRAGSATHSLSRIKWRRIAGFGWQSEVPDVRDHFFAALRLAASKPPVRVDLRVECLQAYDQPRVVSCAASSDVGPIKFETKKSRHSPLPIASRRFIYRNERVFEGSVGNNGDTSLCDGIVTSAAKLATCQG